VWHGENGERRKKGVGVVCGVKKKKIEKKKIERKVRSDVSAEEKNEKRNVAVGVLCACWQVGERKEKKERKKKKREKKKRAKLNG
jgi:hypothetical protein